MKKRQQKTEGSSILFLLFCFAFSVAERIDELWEDIKDSIWDPYHYYTGNVYVRVTACDSASETVLEQGYLNLRHHTKDFIWEVRVGACWYKANEYEVYSIEEALKSGKVPELYLCAK